MVTRMTWAITLALAIVVALMPSACGQEAVKVVEVAVSGNQNINSDTIRNAVALKPGDDYTEAAVEKDRAAIMSLGSFSAVTVHKEDATGGVKITYEVTENPRITEIKIVGSEPISPATILGIMKTKPGQVLNSTTLNQDIDAIQTYYGDQHYIAYITEDIGVDAKTGVLTVPILVHTVESVEITGNKKTHAYVFLREMKTRPGAVFNKKVLDEDMIRIYNLDLLEDIKQYQITPGTEMGMVRIAVPVVEKKTGQISLGLGYSSRQHLVGQARLSETNLRGRGQGLNLLWEQGTTEAVGGASSWELGFYEPWIDKRHTSLSLSGYDKVLYRFSSGIFGTSSFANDTNYNERHKGGDLTLGRPISEKTRVFLGGRFDNVDTDPSLLSLTSDLWRIVEDGNVTGGSLRLVHDARDFALDPSWGPYDSASVELGTVDANRFVLDGAVFNPVVFKGAFQKGSFEFRRYYNRVGPKTSPQDKRTVLAIRLRGGVSGGTLPFFEQFFAGGSESLRGYREDRFWGTKMLLASVELRKPIANAVQGVLFADYGDAWGAPTMYNVGELPQSQSFIGNLGVGVGLRISTPIGHLRLDYGIGSEGGRTHFSMGHAF